MNFLSAIGLPFIPGWDELRPFLADLWLIATILGVLLTPFFVRKPNAACGTVALAGLIAALVSLLIVGSGPEVIGSHFRGTLTLDRVAILWKAMLLLFTMGIVLMWFSVTAEGMHEGDGPEFFALLIGATLGMSLMGSTTNLLMIFMMVELASLPSYVLAGFRKTRRLGAEASLKYVLFGAATSAVMVYGLSMLYGLYGTLQLEGPDGLAARMTATSGGSALLAVAIFGLIVGIGFKISATPFHFWCPDVFEGASIDVSAFLSVASKGAALVLLMRALMLIADAAGYHNSPGVNLNALAVLIGVLGAVTATVGNTGALVQTNIKRLLAYSSIAHAGYMLCALSLLVKSGSSPEGFDPAGAVAQAILLYLAVYVFMNLGAFTVAGLVYRQTGGETLDHFKGLGTRAPVLAACMAAAMVSLLGLPPLGGFAAKVNLLWVLFQNGEWWWTLIIVIAVNTIISAFYYFRVLKAMYLETGDTEPLTAHPLGLATSVACAVMLVVLFIGWNPLHRLTTHYSGMYFAAPAESVAEAR